MAVRPVYVDYFTELDLKLCINADRLSDLCGVDGDGGYEGWMVLT